MRPDARLLMIEIPAPAAARSAQASAASTSAKPGSTSTNPSSAEAAPPASTAIGAVSAAPANPALAWMLAFSDLNMLINTGGRERTEGEYRARLEAAGLRVLAVRATRGPYAVVEAVRA